MAGFSKPNQSVTPVSALPRTAEAGHVQRQQTMNTTLRPPQATDYEALASWIPDATACLRWAGPLIPFPLAATSLPGYLAVPNGTSYVLADGSGMPSAFGQHWVNTPGAVHLGRIIVSPAARGTGLGRSLCQQLIAEAIRTTRAASITLRVYRDNFAALSLYSSLGFVPEEANSDNEVLFMRASAPASSDRT